MEENMNTPEWIKPGLWGAVGGAVVAIAIGFSVGGWVTEGTAEEMAAARAESAVVKAFTPICVANAQREPEKLAALKAESSWQRDAFVEKAGWADGAGTEYRDNVADMCAEKAVEALEASVPKTPT
jgi:hypothetical protein